MKYTNPRIRRKTPTGSHRSHFRLQARLLPVPLTSLIPDAMGGIREVSGTGRSRAWSLKWLRWDPVGVFLRILGFVYFIAFTSFGVQALGLIGSHGISPYGDYLKAIHDQLGGASYRQVPTILWLFPTDG